MRCFALFTRPLAPVVLAAALLATAAAASPAQAGLVFDFTFDTSIAADFGSNASALEADVVAAGAIFSSLFTNNVTLNINVAADTGSGTLAASLASYNDADTYSAVRGALVAGASTPASTAAVNALPLSEPTPNKSAGERLSMAVSTAEEKALNLLAGNASGLDGTVYVGTGANWDFAGTTTPAANAYSFLDAMEHEISEDMGRSTQLTNANFNYNTPIDLFRCTATGPNGTGVINMNPAATNVYFSTDGCATAAKYYNGPNSNGADLQDWATSGTADPYDAYATPGVYSPLSVADQEIMNVLGWQSAVPEPATLLVLLPAAFGLVATRARRRPGVGLSRSPEPVGDARDSESGLNPTGNAWGCLGLHDASVAGSTGVAGMSASGAGDRAVRLACAMPARPSLAGD